MTVLYAYLRVKRVNCRCTNTIQSAAGALDSKIKFLIAASGTPRKSRIGATWSVSPEISSRLVNAEARDI